MPVQLMTINTSTDLNKPNCIGHNCNNLILYCKQFETYYSVHVNKCPRWRSNEVFSVLCPVCGEINDEEFVMAQVGNSENQFSGRYFVQDQDHMSGVNQTSMRDQKRGTRQAEQSQSRSSQQGGSNEESVGQQGGERRRPNR